VKRKPSDIAGADAVATALRQRLPRDLTGYDRTAWVIGQLLAQGQRPTNEAIRAVLEGGSPNTIKAHADQYFRETAQRPVTPSNAVDAMLKKHFREIYDHVRIQVEADYAAKDAELATQRVLANEQLEKAKALAKSAEERDVGARNAVEGMRGQFETLQAEMRSLQGRLGTFQEESAALRQQIADLERAKTATARAHEQALGREQRDAAAQKQAAESALQERNHTNAILNEVQRQMKEIKARAVQDQAEAAGKISAGEKRIARLESDLRAAMAGEKAARAEAGRWHTAHQKLERQNAALQKEHSALAHQINAKPKGVSRKSKR